MREEIASGDEVPAGAMSFLANDREMLKQAVQKALEAVFKDEW